MIADPATINEADSAASLVALEALRRVWAERDSRYGRRRFLTWPHPKAKPVAHPQPLTAAEVELLKLWRLREAAALPQPARAEAIRLIRDWTPPAIVL
jgi:hypothetical protein